MISHYLKQRIEGLEFYHGKRWGCVDCLKGIFLVNKKIETTLAIGLISTVMKLLTELIVPKV